MIEITEQGTTVIVEVAEGIKGDNGASAYEIAVDNGFVGTEAEWLTSLQGADGENAIAINTAFVNKAYSSTMNIAHDADNPNFEIDITGNLNLTVTGTVNGDSGMVNLYFSGTEVATINGVKGLSLTGTGVMIPVYFIHDTDGIRWYDGRESSPQDLSSFPKYIIKDLTPSTAHTGTINETIVKSYLIDANLLSSEDMLNINNLMITKTGSNGALEVRMYKNSADSLVGASVIMTRTGISSAQRFLNYKRSFMLEGGLIKGFSFTTSQILDYTETSVDMSTATFDTTIDNYLLVTIKLGATQDTATVQSCIVTN